MLRSGTFGSARHGSNFGVQVGNYGGHANKHDQFLYEYQQYFDNFLGNPGYSAAADPQARIPVEFDHVAISNGAYVGFNSRTPTPGVYMWLVSLARHLGVKWLIPQTRCQNWTELLPAAAAVAVTAAAAAVAAALSASAKRFRPLLPPSCAFSSPASAF